MRPRSTTILAQERDALGNLLCIYRRYGVYHVGMVLSRGCPPDSFLVRDVRGSL